MEKKNITKGFVVVLSEKAGWWNEEYGPDSQYLGRDGGLTGDPSQVLFIQDKESADRKGVEALAAHGLNSSRAVRPCRGGRNENRTDERGWEAYSHPAVEVDGKVYLPHHPPEGCLVFEEQVYVPLR